ncbi:hypothetical protein BASA50_000002 [Batrachochytrium salamandrivorans]|uniref:Uncharacterized protein n=1 Tax=Batrachochytrium salamandrivorans TaxID=1357716 RepID=A0ABQ8EUU6_9FUNG|nr:hypothetical protein BASA50_000002 [Batrachochytrium salamandrivorans]
MSLLLIPAFTPVSNTTTEATATAAATIIEATTATTTTDMSIICSILLAVVILLAIAAVNYVSIWWYREAGHLEQDTSFELGSHLGPSWTISGLGVCPPYSQPLPMPSSSFLVRGIDERIRDLPMQAEMKAHSHRAVPNVSSPICNEFNPPKIQIIRSGFGQNHHLVSRPARELPQMGGGRQVQGPNPFLASTYQRIPTSRSDIDLDISIGRTVVHLPPPAVHLLPRPVLSSLTPEILAPTVVESIQTLSVAMSAARPSKIRRIQEISDLGCATEEKNRRESMTTTFHEIRKLAKIRRSRRVRFGGAPATPHRGSAMRRPLKAYTRGNQIRPDLLLTPRGKPSVGRLISFWDAPMVAMGISPPPEAYGEVFSYVATTPCQAQNEQCQDMDVSPPKLETGQIKPKTVSGLVSFWNSMSNDMDMDVAPPPIEHGKQYVPVMEWGLSDVKEPTSPMDMPSPSRNNGWESPIAQSSDLPRQSVSVEKIDCLWADPEEELGDLSSLPDDELYHLLGDHEEEELEHLWGVSSGSVDDSVKITPKIATISADNFFRIRTPESPKVETMDMDMSGFLGKENMTPSPTLKSSVSKGYGISSKNPVSSHDITIGGVKWTETIADMPRQSVSSVEMDCSWADSVEHRSPITVPNPFLISESSTQQKSRPQSNNGVSPMPSAVPSPCPAPSITIPVPYSLPLPRPFSYTRGPARTSHGANGFRKKRIGRL